MIGLFEPSEIIEENTGQEQPSQPISLSQEAQQSASTTETTTK